MDSLKVVLYREVGMSNIYFQEHLLRVFNNQYSNTYLNLLMYSQFMPKKVFSPTRRSYSLAQALEP